VEERTYQKRDVAAELLGEPSQPRSQQHAGNLFTHHSQGLVFFVAFPGRMWAAE